MASIQRDFLAFGGLIAQPPAEGMGDPGGRGLWATDKEPAGLYYGHK